MKNQRKEVERQVKMYKAAPGEAMATTLFKQKHTEVVLNITV